MVARGEDRVKSPGTSKYPLSLNKKASVCTPEGGIYNVKGRFLFGL